MSQTIADDSQEPNHRLSHWPYAADHCKATLDLDQIEERAVRILARSIRTQRLEAFVGAGASMAYGRLTWRELMASLFDEINRLARDSEIFGVRKVWNRTRDRLWDDEPEEFLKYSDHALKAQILSDVLELIFPHSPPEIPSADLSRARAAPLQLITKHRLENHHGFAERIVEQVCLPNQRIPALPDKLAELRRHFQEQSSARAQLARVTRIAPQHSIDVLRLTAVPFRGDQAHWSKAI